MVVGDRAAAVAGVLAPSRRADPAHPLGDRARPPLAEEADRLGAPLTRDAPTPTSDGGSRRRARRRDGGCRSAARRTRRARRTPWRARPGDRKLAVLITQLKALLAEGYHPIVFCRYIPTAEYLAEHLDGKLGRKAVIRAVTGTLVAAAAPGSGSRSWPRLAGRRSGGAPGAGRHRLPVGGGEPAAPLRRGRPLRPGVEPDPPRPARGPRRPLRPAARRGPGRHLYGKDNVIDGRVLEVLIKKHRQIRKDLGISVSVPEAAATGVTDAIVEWLLDCARAPRSRARLFDLDELDLGPQQLTLDDEWNSAAERETGLPLPLRAARHPPGGGGPRGRGDPRHARPAERGARVRRAGADRARWRGRGGERRGTSPRTCPAHPSVCATPWRRRSAARSSSRAAGSVPRLPRRWPAARSRWCAPTRSSPRSPGYVLDAALDDKAPGPRPARRCGVIRTAAVTVRTTLLLVRYRFHLTLPSRTGERQLVAEDARLLAFTRVSADARVAARRTGAGPARRSPPTPTPTPDFARAHHANASSTGLETAAEHLDGLRRGACRRAARLAPPGPQRLRRDRARRAGRRPATRRRPRRLRLPAGLGRGRLMSAISRTQVFSAVHTVGGLLPADMLVRARRGQGRGRQRARRLPACRRPLGAGRGRAALGLPAVGVDASCASSCRGRPEAATRRPTPPGVAIREWLLPLFAELGFGALTALGTGGIEADDDRKTFPVSHRWNHVPVHLSCVAAPLDKRAGGAVHAAQSLLQECLNRTEAHLWAIVSNGRSCGCCATPAPWPPPPTSSSTLKRSSTASCSASSCCSTGCCTSRRFAVAEGAAPSACWLETWRSEAITSGARALDQLRDGRAEGDHHARHRIPAPPRQRPRCARTSTSTALHAALLRLVYRLLFVFVAEDRDVLHDPDASEQARQRYAAYFSTARLRAHALRRRGTAHADLYQALPIVLDALGDEHGRPELGLPGLGGIFDADASRRAARMACRWPTSTSWPRSGTSRGCATPDRAAGAAVDYRHLDAEELGSIYESLLELVPRHSAVDRSSSWSTAAGNARKTTGSYYTPIVADRAAARLRASTR